MLMEYMDLGSLESIRKNFGGTIPEHILGRIALPVRLMFFLLIII